MRDFLLYLRVWLTWVTVQLAIGFVVGWLIAEYVL